LLPATEFASSLALLAMTVEIYRVCFAEFTLVSRSSEQSEEEILGSLHSLRMTEGEGLVMTPFTLHACELLQRQGEVPLIIFHLMHI